MSNEFKLTTQDGTNYYFPETKTPLRNETWITNSEWETIFNTIDGKVKGNSQITQQEISLFLNDVENASGDNKVLETNELELLAKKYKTSVSNISNALSTLSGILVANNIYGKFASWFNMPMDLEGAEKSIKEQINPNNVVSIIGHKPDIIKKIVKNYEPEKAINLLDKIFEDLQVSAQKNNIKIDSQINAYNSAKNSQDLESMQRALNQIVQYFRNDYETDQAIANHNPTHTVHGFRTPPRVTAKPIIMTDANRNKLEQLASRESVKVTNDIVGDGVVGNTNSKATTQSGQTVMDALNELLQNETFKEKFNSCYKKEDNRLVLYWPKDDGYFCSTENGLIEPKKNGENLAETSAIGDGDMTLVVSAILKRLANEGQDINNMDKDEVKQYLLGKFDM